MAHKLLSLYKVKKQFHHFIPSSLSFYPHPVSVPLCLLHSETEPLMKLKHREKQNTVQLYIARVKFGDLNQPALSPITLLQRGGVMHEQRWHHRYLSLPSLPPPPPTLLLSHHLYFSSAFIFPVCSSVLFRSSSPTFLISRQMISETGFIPRLSSSSFPPVDLSVSPYSWLSAVYFTLSLLFLRSSGCLPVLLLSSCHLAHTFSIFSPVASLSVSLPLFLH